MNKHVQVYYLKPKVNNHVQVYQTMSCKVQKVEVWLLHQRFDYSSSMSLEALYPEMFSNLGLSMFKCEACDL